MSTNYTREGVLLVLSCIACLIVGIWIASSGWNGLVSGEITIYPKNKPAYSAYAFGAHADEFTFHAWLRLISGALFSTGGFVGLLGYFMSSESKRKELLDITAKIWSPKVPAWFSATVLLAVLVFIFWATNGT